MLLFLQVNYVFQNEYNEWKKKFSYLVRKFLWGKQNDEEVAKVIEEAYEKIVLWKNNLFMLSTDALGKSNITEVTKLMNEWVYDLLFKKTLLTPSWRRPLS